MVSISVSSVVSAITLVVYAIAATAGTAAKIKTASSAGRVATCSRPRSAHTVWQDLDMQIGNYVCKFWEMLILWWATYVSFAIFGINFAMLLPC